MRFVKRGSSTSSSGRGGRHVRPRFLAPRGLIGRTGIAALLLFGGLVGFRLLPAFAATTWTVCSSGCNFTSIQAAIDAPATVAGDTISVLAGTYVGDLTIDKQLTLSGPHADTAAGDVVNGSVITRTDEAIVEGTTNAGVSVTATGVIIDGLKFIRPRLSAANQHVRLISGMTGGVVTTVRNSVMDLSVSGPAVGCGSAISSGNSATDLATRFILEGNVFQWQQFNPFGGCLGSVNPQRVIYLDSAMTNNVIRGNYFYNTNHVFITDSAWGTVVDGNYFRNSIGQAQIAVGSAKNVEVTDNIFNLGGDARGVFVDSAIDLLIEGNTFIGGGRYHVTAEKGASGLTIRGNSFASLSSNPAIWIGEVSPVSTGVVITNNTFASTVERVLYNCFSTGTKFNWNNVASTGPGSEVDVGKPIRNGGGFGDDYPCSGTRSLDASLNYWNGLATPVYNAEGWSASLVPPITGWTPNPARAGEPGFWPLTTTLVAPVAPTPDAPVVETPVVLPDGGTTSVQLDFGAITAGGNLTVTTAATPADGTFSLGGNPVISITFDGTFTPPVKVCLTYSDASFAPGATPQLFHYTGGVWSALPTVSLDPVGKVICANTDSFSEFGVGVSTPRVAGSGTTTGLHRHGARHIHRHFHPKAWCWHRHAHERIFEQHRKGARHLMLRRHLDEHPEHAHKPRRCPSGFHHR